MGGERGREKERERKVEEEGGRGRDRSRAEDLTNHNPKEGWEGLY